MLCLVPEGPHPQHGPDAAAQNCRNEKGLLRDAAFLRLRPLLVHVHHQKGREIDTGEPDENDKKADLDPNA